MLQEVVRMLCTSHREEGRACALCDADRGKYIGFSAEACAYAQRKLRGDGARVTAACASGG